MLIDFVDEILSFDSNLFLFKLLLRKNVVNVVKSGRVLKKEEKETETGGISSFFYSIIPKEILGVPVQEIKKDINEGRSQISTL